MYWTGIQLSLVPIGEPMLALLTLQQYIVFYIVIVLVSSPVAMWATVVIVISIAREQLQGPLAQGASSSSDQQHA
jgi:hypothetical protein